MKRKKYPKSPASRKFSAPNFLTKEVTAIILFLVLGLVLLLPTAWQLVLFFIVIFLSHREWQKLAQLTTKPLRWFAVGFFYMLLVAVAGVYVLTAHPLWFLITMLITIANDVAGLVIGKNFGKTPLAKKISPNKTWEGAVASMVFGILVGCLSGYFLLQHWQIILPSAIIIIAGILGDLFESLLKRTAGVKDASNIIPGHGGLLDRLDSHFLAMGATALMLYFNLLPQ